MDIYEKEVLISNIGIF